MAWPNPFRRHGPNTVNAWGYVFDLTEDHFTAESSHKLKYSYDVLAEECLQRLDEISPPPRSALPRNIPIDTSLKSLNQPPSPPPPAPTPAPSSDSPSTNTTPTDSTTTSPPDSQPTSSLPPPPPPQRDLYALLRDNASTDPKLHDLWTQVNHVPSWVDWAQIQRGQDVFYRYGGACVTGLAYQSLLGGMGAARVVETLARTGGFSAKKARGRLFETTQHILQCTKSLEAMQPGGEGFAATIRVRFLHAAVRRRIMKLAKERPEYYNVEEFGVPINDLDSIATISTFSATLIWLSLPRQGLYMKKQEIEDYTALWRYIAHVIGCPTSYFATPAKAKAAMESLYYLEVHPTDMSALLANNIIKSLEDQPPGYASAEMLIASARWMNGHKLCDALKLPRPGLYYYSLILGQCVFFCFFGYLYRAIPSWDEWRVEWVKKVFWQITVESKWALNGSETMFEFKYVPEFDTVTSMDDGKDIKKERRVTERRNLKWMLYGVGAVGVVVPVVGYCVVKAVGGVLRLGWAVLGNLGGS